MPTPSSDSNERSTGGFAIVTGGSSGVGKAAVEQFIDAGMDVMFTYFSREKEAYELADRLSDDTACCTAVRLDTGNESQVLDFAKKYSGRAARCLCW